MSSSSDEFDQSFNFEETELDAILALPHNHYRGNHAVSAAGVASGWVPDQFAQHAAHDGRQHASSSAMAMTAASAHAEPDRGRGYNAAASMSAAASSSHASTSAVPNSSSGPGPSRKRSSSEVEHASSAEAHAPGPSSSSNNHKKRRIDPSSTVHDPSSSPSSSSTPAQVPHSRQVPVKVIDALVDELQCAICMELMVHPHACVPCGHAACAPCLDQWLSRPGVNRCPVCRERLNPATAIIPNYALKNVVNAAHPFVDADTLKSWTERTSAWKGKFAHKNVKPAGRNPFAQWSPFAEVFENDDDDEAWDFSEDEADFIPMEPAAPVRVPTRGLAGQLPPVPQMLQDRFRATRQQFQAVQAAQRAHSMLDGYHHMSPRSPLPPLADFRIQPVELGMGMVPWLQHVPHNPMAAMVGHGLPGPAPGLRPRTVGPMSHPLYQQAAARVAQAAQAAQAAQIHPVLAAAAAPAPASVLPPPPQDPHPNRGVPPPPVNSPPPPGAVRFFPTSPGRFRPAPSPIQHQQHQPQQLYHHQQPRMLPMPQQPAANNMGNRAPIPAGALPYPLVASNMGVSVMGSGAPPLPPAPRPPHRQLPPLGWRGMLRTEHDIIDLTGDSP
ncbi:hypothetical protein BKA62DRAFT_493444 [Auriculariales sp. MPI-PUGE-AT-0066]|nr:hypothetical protein BKA62DRAFT_493444 [Auriculariales sp. MPI-PUGE-AT-0066]